MKSISVNFLFFFFFYPIDKYVEDINAILAA